MIRNVLLLLALVAVSWAAKGPIRQKAGRPQVVARQAEVAPADTTSAIPATSATPVQIETRGDDLQLTPEFICSVFGGPSCPNNVQDAKNVPCSCSDNYECECVPYYQCDNTTGAYNKDGVGVIDIRQDETEPCPHYMQKCCKLDSILHPTLPPPDHIPIKEEPEEVPLPSDTEHPNYNENPGSYPRPPTYPESEQPSYPTQPTPSYPEQPVPEYPEQPEPSYPEQPTQGFPEPQTPSYSEPTPGHPEHHTPEYPEPTQGYPDYTSGPKVPEPQLCGQRNPDGVGVRITGDEDGEAQFGEFPWMVAILNDLDSETNRRNLYLCGGALIAPGFVLTAAHCVKDKKPVNLKIRAGEWDTQTSNEIYKHQDRKVAKIIIHPEYYGGAVHNDVAILVLHEVVNVGYHIGTICLPEQGDIFDHKHCFVSGWGKDKFGKDGQYQVILKKLELPVVPRDQCQQQLRKTRLGHHFELHHSFICAGGEAGKDTCKGDGGSPLVCPLAHDHTRYQVAGLVAWGIDCGLAGVPGVYVNVPLFRHWIDEEINKILDLDARMKKPETETRVKQGGSKPVRH